MELRQLRSLTLLADLGSISAAATFLHISAPAIHKQLRELETELNVKLYERVGRTLRLSPAAEVLLPYARELFAQHQSAVTAIDEWKGLKKGSIRIGAGPTTSSYILPGLLRKFRRAYPSVELYIETGNTRALIDRVTGGVLDVALLVAPRVEEEPHLAVEIAWQVEFVLIAKSRLSIRPLNLKELQKYKFILYQKGSRIENLIDEYFIEARFQPNVIMRSDNPEAIKAMVRTGLGISMLPMWVLDSELKRGTLSVIHQRERPLLSYVELVSRKTNVFSNAVRGFIEVAKRYECKKPRLVLTSQDKSLSLNPSSGRSPHNR